MAGQPNVVWIVLDTVRADHVSSYGYDRETTPQFDAFAADATQYTDAVTQGVWSIPSHGSLFTGKYPTAHGATTIEPVLRDEQTVAELLGEAGYETYAVSANEYVRPLTGFGRGFDEFHTLSRMRAPQPLVDRLAPVINRLASLPDARCPAERLFNGLRKCNATTTGLDGPSEDGTVDRVEDVLGRATSPFFLFANLMDCHLPRSPAPRHAERFVDDDLADVEVVANERAHTFGDVEMDQQAVRKMRQLYDADLRTMDDRLGALLDALEAAGVLDDSLVIIASDHGENLGEFSQFGHQFNVFDSVTSVPLVVQYPDGGPDHVGEQVELRRLFHTVLDETGVASYPDRSLASGRGDEVAHGEFYTPMLDLDALLWDDEVVYDSDLVGEALSFVRDGETKLVSFGNSEWLFDLPEWAGGRVPRDESQEHRERLVEQAQSGVTTTAAGTD